MTVAAPRIIKRYQNRKIYDCQDSNYITLNELHAMFQKDDNIKVIDNKTGHDITKKALIQCIFAKEQEKDQDMHVLLQAIRSSDGTLSGLVADDTEANSVFNQV